MANPELKPDFKAFGEKLKESHEARPRTDLQKDYHRIDSLMNDLENPAPGMDKKLAQDKDSLYAQLNMPEEASLETIRIAFGQAVAAEKAMDASKAAKEAFKQAGVESPYRIARVAVEYNVLADEVGDLKESGLAKMDISQEARDKMKKFESINEEWEKITNAMQEYVTEKIALGSMEYDPKTSKVVKKRAQGEKSPARMTPSR